MTCISNEDDQMKALFISTSHNRNSNRRKRRSNPSCCIWLSLQLCLSYLSTLGQSISCHSDQECEMLLRTGSQCWEGSCTNPYTHGGCLKNHLPEEFKNIRTCNSEDPIEVTDNGGYCRPSEMDYMEIRIGSQNWEGAFFAVWIMQIILSELLNVPVSVETGERDKNVNFYHIHSSMDYGTINNFDGLEMAAEIGDCRKLKQKSSDDYIKCQHITPEMWTESFDLFYELEKANVIEAPLSLGALGEIGWYIPKYTAEKDLTMLHYLGLAGEKNRRKLAETFLRPTTWKDYCDVVSFDNCQTDNGVAARPPNSTEEQNSYFQEGSYIGHFRKTERNDCDKYPMNCTGHIVDFPCEWTSYVNPITYHHSIALESNGQSNPASGGYSYSQMLQIWEAANATKSDVIMVWWTPEALVGKYSDTDADFQRIALPRPTQTCLEHRVLQPKQCSSNLTEQRGDPRGACDHKAQILHKVLVSSLFEHTQNPDIAEAFHNPAYQALKAFHLSELQVNEIFVAWLAKGRDKWNFDPREATCEWVADNLKHIKSFVPKNHPRAIQTGGDRRLSFYISIIIAIFAMVLCIVSMYMTFRLRNCVNIQYAQLEFLTILLIGLFLVSLGGLFNALQRVVNSCTAVIWLFNMGYTLALVPLIIKITAINRLMRAARRMQKVHLKRTSLFGIVLLVGAIVCIILITWTVIDPPTKSVEYMLSGDDTSKTSEGEFIVRKVYYCSSKSEIWFRFSFGWQCLLLVCGTVLAFQTRNVREEINETQTLAMMIYSHVVFLVLRGILYVLENSLRQAGLEAIQSINYSADAAGVIVVYFVPKFLYVAQQEQQEGTTTEDMEPKSVRSLRSVRFQDVGN